MAKETYLENLAGESNFNKKLKSCF